MARIHWSIFILTGVAVTAFSVYLNLQSENNPFMLFIIIGIALALWGIFRARQNPPKPASHFPGQKQGAHQFQRPLSHGQRR